MKKNFPKCETCETRGKSVFCSLDKKHLEQFDNAKTSNTYKAHQTIFYEGNNAFGLYCINEGKVKLFKSDASGHQKIVRLLGPGDMLGYRCLLTDAVYTATAEAITDCKICFIDKKTFLQTLDEDPKTMRNVMSALADDLRRAESQTLNLVHKNVRERLAELLLFLKMKYGKKTEQGYYLDILLTREELAEMIGTTQESAIRLISEFKQDKYILVEGRKITLLNIDALLQTAAIFD